MPESIGSVSSMRGYESDSGTYSCPFPWIPVEIAQCRVCQDCCYLYIFYLFSLFTCLLIPFCITTQWKHTPHRGVSLFRKVFSNFWSMTTKENQRTYFPLLRWYTGGKASYLSNFNLMMYKVLLEKIRRPISFFLEIVSL